METCALPAREGVLPLLAFAGLSQERGPVTAQGFAAYGHTGQTAGPSPTALSRVPAPVPGNSWCHHPWVPWDPEPTLSLQGLYLTSPPEHLKAGVSPTLGDFCKFTFCALLHIILCVDHQLAPCPCGIRGYVSPR